MRGNRKTGKVSGMKKTATTASLTENYLFRRLYRKGTSGATPNIAVYYQKNRLGYNRLGVTVSKKVGNAVQRNRARRVIVEAYRQAEVLLPVGLDIVVVARQRAAGVKMQEIQRNLLRILAPKNKADPSPRPTQPDEV